MGTYEDLLNWALWIGGIAIALASIAWFAWALFSDRARARRRCPSCWYDFATLDATTPCPECGRVPESEQHLMRTRRRPFHALLAGVFLIFGYALWALPRVFEERSETGFIPTTFLTLAAPTLNSQAIADASNLRGLALARLDRGEIKQPWRWLWRQRVKLAHALTATPYLEVAWSDVKSIYPPPKPPQPRVYYESPIQLDGPDPEPTIEEFGELLMELSDLATQHVTPPTTGTGVAIGECWLASGPSECVGQAAQIIAVLKQARAERDRIARQPHRRFDPDDISEDMAIVARLDSIAVPAWDDEITLPQLAERISIATGCPVELDLEPSELTKYEASLEPAARPAASVRVTLGALCAATDAQMTWTVRDGRIVIRRRPAVAREDIGLPLNFVNPTLATFDIADLIAQESAFTGKGAAPYIKTDVLGSLVVDTIDWEMWVTNGGNHPMGIVGDFLVVKADPPTLHLVGHLLDIFRQTEPSLGALRERDFSWGGHPEPQIARRVYESTLSGTLLNSPIIAYNLNPALGEAITDPDESDEAWSAHVTRDDALHRKGGLTDQLGQALDHLDPDAQYRRPWFHAINETTLLVIAPAPAQARVAKFLRDHEADRLAAPDITTPPNGDALSTP